jgi:type IV fimbrial biogenesis protein FimT
MNRPRQLGFTLWELLVTMLVAGVLFGIGVPNFMEFQRNSGMSAASNDLVTALLTARTEAVKRQAPVTVCLSGNPNAPNPVCLPNPIADAGLPPAPNPAVGYVVWVDENNNFNGDGTRNLLDGTDGNAVIDPGELIITRVAAPGGTIQVSANCGYISYTPTGITRRVGALCFPQPRAVLFCDDRGRAMAAGSMSAARVVSIDLPGRGQVRQDPADVTALITGPALAGINPTCPP